MNGQSPEVREESQRESAFFGLMSASGDDAFGKASMQRINVLSIQRISAEDRAKIEAVDPAIELTDAGGWYDGEIRETWPAFTTARYLVPGATGSGTRGERDRLLAEAEVILGGWPFPLDLCARAPRLKWFHQRPAGASNLLVGDLWGSRVVVTTSRGSGNTLAMAEPVFCTLPRASTAPRSIGARACSTIAHIDHFYWKVRLRASWAPAESGSMSVNSERRLATSRRARPRSRRSRRAGGENKVKASED